jgi:uncharacterized protein YukE
MPDAEVIPFPVTPMRRLESALQNLVKAQEEQRRAVQAFQDSVAQLRTQTTLLRESVRDFDEELRQLGQEARRVHAAALTLEHTAGRL